MSRKFVTVSLRLQFVLILTDHKADGRRMVFTPLLSLTIVCVFTLTYTALVITTMLSDPSGVNVYRTLLKTRCV